MSRKDRQEDWDEGIKVLVGFKNACLITIIAGGLILFCYHAGKWLGMLGGN